MNSLIKAVVSVLTAAVFLLTASFCYFLDADFNQETINTYAEESDGESPDEKVGTEDILSFDADPDLHLPGENDPAPEDYETGKARLRLHGDSDGDVVVPDEVDPTNSDEDDPQAPMYNWFGIPESNESEVSFLLKKNGKRFEYRSLAKQKMYGYDTFQGNCAHGKYSWHILYNRKSQKCRIIKVSLKSNKVLKVSKPLPLDHGNDMAYDTKRDRLLVVHYGDHVRRISIVDPKTLKRISYADIETPTERLPGASTAFSKSIKGVSGIGYDEEHDEYIASIQGARHYLVMDPDFNLKSVIKVPVNDPYVRQGMTVKNGFIIRAFSAYNSTYNQNILYVYDLAGHFVKTVKLGQGFEIESIYFRGDKLYASTYTSYYKKITKKVKKTVKVNKNGKIVKVKKKVKVTYYSLRRDNNVIRIKEY